MILHPDVHGRKYDHSGIMWSVGPIEEALANGYWVDAVGGFDLMFRVHCVRRLKSLVDWLWHNGLSSSAALCPSAHMLGFILWDAGTLTSFRPSHLTFDPQSDLWVTPRSDPGKLCGCVSVQVKNWNLFCNSAWNIKESYMEEQFIRRSKLPRCECFFFIIRRREKESNVRVFMPTRNLKNCFQ